MEIQFGLLLPDVGDYPRDVFTSHKRAAVEVGEELATFLRLVAIDDILVGIVGRSHDADQAQKPSDQVAKFRELAREAECDQDEGHFTDALKRAAASGSKMKPETVAKKTRFKPLAVGRQTLNHPEP
jgi:hypothetical protein